MSTNWQVAVGAEHTTAVFEPATALDQQTVFVCAHGAGGHMSDRGMLATAAELRARGISVVRFNFPYREKASGRPDPMPRLKECVESVVKRARAELDPRLLVIGGRSMGGRAASMLAARWVRVRRVAPARISTSPCREPGAAPPSTSRSYPGSRLVL